MRCVPWIAFAVALALLPSAAASQTAEHHFENARAAYARGQYATAADALLDARRLLGRDTPRVSSLQALVYDALGDLYEARRAAGAYLAMVSPPAISTADGRAVHQRIVEMIPRLDKEITRADSLAPRYLASDRDAEARRLIAADEAANQRKLTQLRTDSAVTTTRMIERVAQEERAPSRAELLQNAPERVRQDLDGREILGMRYGVSERIDSVFVVGVVHQDGPELSLRARVFSTNTVNQAATDAVMVLRYEYTAQPGWEWHEGEFWELRGHTPRHHSVTLKGVRAQSRLFEWALLDAEYPGGTVTVTTPNKAWWSSTGAEPWHPLVSPVDRWTLGSGRSVLRLDTRPPDELSAGLRVAGVDIGPIVGLHVAYAPENRNSLDTISPWRPIHAAVTLPFDSISLTAQLAARLPAMMVGGRSRQWIYSALEEFDTVHVAELTKATPGERHARVRVSLHDMSDRDIQYDALVQVRLAAQPNGWRPVAWTTVYDRFSFTVHPNRDHPRLGAGDGFTGGLLDVGTDRAWLTTDSDSTRAVIGGLDGATRVLPSRGAFKVTPRDGTPVRVSVTYNYAARYPGDWP